MGHDGLLPLDALDRDTIPSAHHFLGAGARRLATIQLVVSRVGAYNTGHQLAEQQPKAGEARANDADVYLDAGPYGDLDKIPYVRIS